MARAKASRTASAVKAGSRGAGLADGVVLTNEALAERGWRFVAPNVGATAQDESAVSAPNRVTRRKDKLASKPRRRKLKAGERRLAAYADSQYRAALPDALVDFHLQDGSLPGFAPKHKGQCSPETCWDFKDHSALLDGWSMAQRLPGRLGITLYQLSQKYAGFAMRNGQFYISWTFISDVVRVERRTFNNYISKLVRLGYLRVVERALNQWGVTYYDFVHCCGAQQLPLGTYVAQDTLYAARVGVEPSVEGLLGLDWEWADDIGDATYEEVAADVATAPLARKEPENESRMRVGDIQSAEASAKAVEAAWDEGYDAGLRGAVHDEAAQARGDARMDDIEAGGILLADEDGRDGEARIDAEASEPLTIAESVAAPVGGGCFGQALGAPDLGARVKGLLAIVGKGGISEDERVMLRRWDVAWRDNFGGDRVPDEFLMHSLLEARNGRSFRGLFFGVLRRAMETNVALYEGAGAEALAAFTSEIKARMDRQDALGAYWAGIPEQAMEGGVWF